MPTTLPSVVPNWANGGGAQNTEPATGIKSQGFVGGEHPPADFLNWILGNNSEWATFLSQVNAALKLQGFEVSAQTVPNNTVAVKAGRILGANSAVTYAGGNSAAFDNRHATLSRIDLLYLTAAGALAIAKGTPNATPANGRQAYGGRYVIAEVTITFDAGAGVAVILAGDIADVRSIQATRSAQWADYVGTFFNGGGAAPKITMYASATEFRIGVNCDANYLNTGTGELDPGFTIGRFDTGKTIAVLLFRVGDGGTVATASNTFRLYFAPEGWTDNGIATIPLTISLDFGYNGAWQKRVWTGAALEDLATENYVDAADVILQADVDTRIKKGCSGTVNSNGANGTNQIKNENLVYLGDAAFGSSASFQVRRDGGAGTGRYKLLPPTSPSKAVTDYRLVSITPVTPAVLFAVVNVAGAWTIFFVDNAFAPLDSDFMVSVME